MIPEARIAKFLKSHKKTLSVAESCSGGQLSDRITNVPGSSSFFRLGVVAYSNTAKIKILHIPDKIIKKYGAVSEVVAKMMAKNVRALLNTDFGVGITGIAGPTGGTKQKPVGLVYIAVAKDGVTILKEFQFKGNRLRTKNQAASQALKILLNLITK